MPPFETNLRQESGTQDKMALIFQEVMTIIVRLRAGRQRVAEPEVFRSQVRNLLKTAETDGARRGYAPEDLRMASFAVVAFLDESIEHWGDAVFGDWRRKPLQDEMFGVQTGGEVFFRNVERMLSRPNSDTVADLLEVYQLCLLLGFHGRYRAGGSKPEIREILSHIEEKMRAIRGAGTAIDWKPPAERMPRARGDKWIPWLRWSAAGFVLLAALLFFIFKAMLASNSAELKAIANGVSF